MTGSGRRYEKNDLATLQNENDQGHFQVWQGHFFGVFNHFLPVFFINKMSLPHFLAKSLMNLAGEGPGPRYPCV